MLLSFILTVSVMALVSAFGVAIAHDSARKVGGLTFWTIGRVGGSFYVRRA